MKLPRAVVAIALATVLSASCGGPSANQECRYESWTGTCELYNVTKVRVLERFPVAITVLEGIYYAKKDATSPGDPPPEIRQEFTVRSDAEEALRAHLTANRLVQCRGQALVQGMCERGPQELAVPPFTPPPPPPDPETQIASGCEGLTADPSSRAAPGSTHVAMPKVVWFDRGSATLPPDAGAIADQIARALQQNPNVECVGVVGYILSGEDIPMANERARQVKEMLVTRGIDPKRLVTYGATVPDSTPGEPGLEKAGTHGRAQLTVLRVR